ECGRRVSRQRVRACESIACATHYHCSHLCVIQQEKIPRIFSSPSPRPLIQLTRGYTGHFSRQKSLPPRGPSADRFSPSSGWKSPAVSSVGTWARAVDEPPPPS